MSWSLAYAHDSEGNKMEGSKKNLIAAVSNGSPIRVLMISGDDIWAMGAEHLWVRRDIVYAQNTSQVGARFAGDRRTLVEDGFMTVWIVDSLGRREGMSWNLGEHVGRGPFRSRVEMKWYFFDPLR